MLFEITANFRFQVGRSGTCKPKAFWEPTGCWCGSTNGPSHGTSLSQPSPPLAATQEPYMDRPASPLPAVVLTFIAFGLPFVGLLLLAMHQVLAHRAA